MNSGYSYGSYMAAVADSIKKHPQHTIVGDKVYTRVLLIVDWPKDPVEPGFLEALHNMKFPGLPPNVVVEVHGCYRKAIMEWGLKTNWKYNRLYQKIKSEQTPDPTEVNALEAMEKLKSANLYGGADIIDIWKYVIVRSIGDPGSLDTVCRRITSNLKDVGIKVSLLTHEQQEAFREVFVLGRANEKYKKSHPGRIVQASALAALYPFLAGSISDGQGAYVGHSVSTRSANHLNLKIGEENKNIVVVGAGGEGKSTFQKAFIESLRLEGFLVIVFDMNGEYKEKCEKTGGLYIDHTLGTGKYIDPLTIPDKIGIPEEDNTRLLSVSDTLLTTVSILANGIIPEERNAADRALMQLYKKYKIDLRKPETWEFEEQPFNIKDWWNCLAEDAKKGAQGAVSLSEKLDIYFTGSKQQLFEYSEKITIPPGCNLVVFQVGTSIEGVDGQVGAAKMSMTMSFVRDVLRKEKRLGKRYTAVFFDEAQRILLDPEMSIYINQFATMIRHMNGLIVVATNKPHVFWVNKTGGEGGTGIWANSKYKVFFWLENSEIKAVEKNAEIPKEIIDMLKTMYQTKQFLIRTEKGWDKCKVYLPPEELALYKTRGLKTDV
ncbi:MAG: VirB4 family type IV secretion system protein [Bacillota bacterium]